MTLSFMSGLDDGKPIFSTYLESIVQGLLGRYVKNGCDVSPVSGEVSVSVDSGNVVFGGNEFYFPGGKLSLNAPLTDKDRADVVVMDFSNGVPELSVITGTRWVTLPDGSVVPITDRISDTQIPLAVVIVRANATEVLATDIYDVRSSMILNDIIGTSVLGSVAKRIWKGRFLNLDVFNIVPPSDAKGNVGNENRRFENIYGVNVYTGDIVFENDWRVSEYDDDGNLIDGLRILDSNGNEVLRITKDGIWYLGNKVL